MKDSYIHAMCVHCGREVVMKRVRHPSVIDIDQNATCCRVPKYFWILPYHPLFTRNVLHKEHVENTRRKVDGN